MDGTGTLGEGGGGGLEAGIETEGLGGWGGRRGTSVSQFCVKLRGLPWSASKDDIADFLERCNILGGHRGIIVTTDDRGRPSGDAYVEVEAMEDVELALRMHKRDMGSRWVGVGRV